MHDSKNSKCPQPEETNDDIYSTSPRRNPQRCHRQMSPSQFRSRFATSPTPVPFLHQRQFENALTSSHPVWEKESRATPDLAWRLQPFQQGPSVKKPSIHSTPAKETRVGIPSGTSLQQLRSLREQSGQQKKVRFDIKKQSPTPDVSNNT